MDPRQFDIVARSLTGNHSRRTTLSAMAAGLVAAISRWRPGSAQAATPTPLPVCTDPSRPGVGCSCTTGTEYPCGQTTLLCCPTAPNAAPGAAGVCTPASVGCNPTGRPSCEGIGCNCRGGVNTDCSPGLVCCQSQMTAPNVPGGPGMCAAPDACGNGVSATPQATPVV